MSRDRKTKRYRFGLARSNWARATAGLLLWTGSGAMSSHVLAQAPTTPAAVASTPAGGGRYHLNKHTIQLPIQLDEKFRPQLQEIHLYYKDQPSAAWTLREKVPATQTAFTFQAPRDGEYLFTMVTVDRQGKCVPADITKEEPALTVVVDTVAPQLDVGVVGTVPEGQLIQCDLRDAHPDPTKTRLQYQTADKVFRDLSPVADRPNVYCIPAQANTTGQIRVYAYDLAGNLGTREYNTAKLPAAGAVAMAPQAPTPERVAPPQPAPVTPAAMQTVAKSIVPVQAIEPTPMPATAPAAMPHAEKPAAAPSRLPNNVAASPALGTPGNNVVPQGPPIETVEVNKKVLPVAPDAESPAIQKVANVTPASDSVSPTQPVQPAIAAPVAPPVAQVTPSPTGESKAPVATTIAPKREGTPVHRQLVGSTRLFLEYNIEKAGASGVGRVDVWCTRDRGQTWLKLCEDSDRKSPAEVNLPGDGIYGLTLVVSNGLGFGAQPPAPGDTPEMWIEVDTTRPVAQITTVRLATEDVPVVHVGWVSQDRNLGSGPAELFYGTSRHGPWMSIAKNLKAEGQFRWVPPMDIGTKAFIRLAVRDEAGNRTITETTQPIALDDLSRPRARMVGVSVDSVTPATSKSGER